MRNDLENSPLELFKIRAEGDKSGTRLIGHDDGVEAGRDYGSSGTKDPVLSVDRCGQRDERPHAGMHGRV